jgi:hypothetical protein
VVVDTLDKALATFQSRNDNEGLNYSVKVTDIDKIKEVHIDIGKPVEKVDVVAEMYKSETPSCQVLGNLCKGNITSQQLKGPLKEKDTHELIKKIEKGEDYVDIVTEDNPNGEEEKLKNYHLPDG